MDESSSQKSEQVSVPWQWNSRPRPSAPGLLAETALGSRLGAADGRAGHGELDLHGLGQGEHLWRYKSSLSCWKDRKVVGTSSRWVGGASTGSRSHLCGTVISQKIPGRRSYRRCGPHRFSGRHRGRGEPPRRHYATGHRGSQRDRWKWEAHLVLVKPEAHAGAAPGGPAPEGVDDHPSRAAGRRMPPVACQLSGLCLPSVLFGGGCS